MNIRSLFLLLAFVTFSNSLWAHPPDAIQVGVKGDTVQIDVSHPTNNPSKHYINLIEVSLNGQKIKSETYTAQTGNDQKLVFQIPGLKKGDQLEVKAVCNKFGDLTEKQTVA